MVETAASLLCCVKGLALDPRSGHATWHGGRGFLVTHWQWQYIIGIVWPVASNHRSKKYCTSEGSAWYVRMLVPCANMLSNSEDWMRWYTDSVLNEQSLRPMGNKCSRQSGQICQLKAAFERAESNAVGGCSLPHKLTFPSSCSTLWFSFFPSTAISTIVLGGIKSSVTSIVPGCMSVLLGVDRNLITCVCLVWGNWCSLHRYLS